MERISEEMWTKDVTWNHMGTVGVLSGLPGQTSFCGGALRQKRLAEWLWISIAEVGGTIDPYDMITGV
jgi:uncharacterized protein YegJ (DUF2314 family)